MRRQHTSQKGAAAVEFALVLPLLIVLTFGIIEFGVFLYNQQVITNASREGARAGIVATGSARVTAAEIRTIVQNYCASRLFTFGSQNTPILVPDPPLGYDSAAVSGTDLTVRVQYTYRFLLLPNFVTLTNQRNMTATTVMKYE
jgi:Flp pilus assembly protein TadG